MGPGGFGGFCLALLCFGVALGWQEEESGHGNVTEEGTPEPPGQRSAATGDGDTVTTRPGVTASPPGSGDTAGTAAGNGTRASPGVPARYWSPVIFVVLALLVLLVTYHRTRDRGIRDQVTSGSDSSDLGALVQPQDPDPIPKIPTQKDPEPPPRPELCETSLGPPEPSGASGFLGKGDSETGPAGPTA